jgi:hypothetical protein
MTHFKKILAIMASMSFCQILAAPDFQKEKEQLLTKDFFYKEFIQDNGLQDFIESPEDETELFSFYLVKAYLKENITLEEANSLIERFEKKHFHSLTFNYANSFQRQSSLDWISLFFARDLELNYRSLQWLWRKPLYNHDIFYPSGSFENFSFLELQTFPKYIAIYMRLLSIIMHIPFPLPLNYQEELSLFLKNMCQEEIRLKQLLQKKESSYFSCVLRKNFSHLQNRMEKTERKEKDLETITIATEKEVAEEEDILQEKLKSQELIMKSLELFE